MGGDNTNRKVALFSLLIVSVLLLTSLADVAFAGKIKLPPEAEVSIEKSNQGNRLDIHLSNIGGGVIVKFTLALTGVTLEGAGPAGWKFSLDGSYIEFTAKGKSVLHYGDSVFFTASLLPPVGSFTATWHAYDRRGNSAGTGIYTYTAPTP